MKRPLLYFDPTSISSSSPSSSQETKRSPLALKPNLFQKFFPKYLKDLSLETKGGSIISKLKRTKVIRDFTANPLNKRPEWRLIIANKAKSVKTLQKKDTFTNQFVEKIKLLSGLTSIHIFLFFDPHSSYSKQRDYSSLIKACHKMQSLKELKNLEFASLNKLAKSLIQKLDSSPRLLKPLKNLNLSCRWRRNGDPEMMEILKNSKNLLKYCTSLKLGKLRSPSHHASFQALAGSCPNLSSFSLEFCCLTYHPVEINYLSTVKTFENLKSLELWIGDIFTFLGDFVVPPLVENLLLNFEQSLSKETLCRINHIFIDYLEENPTLSRFYENFPHLHNLKGLQILFRSDIDVECYQYQSYLSQSILKRISSSLKQLTFMGTPYAYSRQKDIKPLLSDSYFSQLFQSISHLSGTLETLEIGNERVILSSFDLSSLKNKFVKLSAITITGVLESLDADFNLFLEQIISLGDSLIMIKLKIFVDCNTKSLISILKQRNQLDKPERLKIDLQVKLFENKNEEVLKSDFEDCMKEFQGSSEEHLKLKGVSLKLYVDENILKYLRQFLEIYSKKFDHFAIASNSFGFSEK